MKLLCFFAVSLTLLAQPPQPPPQDPEKAALEGQVLNAVSNEPLRKVTLTLRMNVAALQTQRGQEPVATTYSVTSDAMGKFAFANVDPGDYQLHAVHDGFADLVLGNTGSVRKGEPILLGRGDRKLAFTAKMIPYGALAGMLFDEDGDPIRNLRVSAMAYRYTPNGRELREVRSAVSNDLGEYRIFDLPAARYFLKINPQALQMFGNEPTPRDSYATVYYPGRGAGERGDSAGSHSRTATARAYIQFAQGPLRDHPRKSDRASRCDQCECGTADRHRGRLEQHFEQRGRKDGQIRISKRTAGVSYT